LNKVAARAARLGGRTFRSGLDAGVTIAARAPNFLMAGFNPNGADAREVKIAVAEKAEAVFDGAMSAHRKIGDLWLRAVFGRLTADDAATAWIDVCDAALAPARVRVRANAKRLTR
jgi:hypothetical protein